MDPFQENVLLRWRATPAFWRVALVAFMLGLILSMLIPPVDRPSLAIGIVRTLLATGAIVSIVVNKRVADDFYLRVYADASAIALVISAVVFFACSPYALDIAFSSLMALVTLVATWWIGYVIAFLRLRNR